MNWDLRASLVRMKTDNLRVHSDCRIVISDSGSNRERRESDVPLLQRT